jgi:hypothetical protein
MLDDPQLEAVDRDQGPKIRISPGFLTSAINLLRLVC